MRNRRFCDLEFLFLFTFEGNIQCAIKVLRLAMEHTDGDKCKIVFTSPEAMMELSGEKKLKPSLSARQKNKSRYFFLRYKQNSPVTSHARFKPCKECFHISNRPLPIHVHPHEISKFLNTETWLLLIKCCQSASLLNFKWKIKFRCDEVDLNPACQHRNLPP